nr:MAG TPA: hypothetical protein [Caudoviricetes sp.]
MSNDCYNFQSTPCHTPPFMIHFIIFGGVFICIEQVR